MNKAILVFAIAILLVAPVMALDFTHTKSYDEKTQTITIKSFPLIGRDITTIKLNTPLNYMVGAGYGKVAELEVDLFDDTYSDAFNKMEFYDLNNNERKFEREFDYKYLTIESVDVNDYKEVCSTSGNGTKICSQEIIGTHKEEREVWKDLDTSILTKGKITIGIFTNVKVGDYVEWIPTLFGKEIDEWATWQASLNVGLVSWYKLNQITGVVLDSRSVNNGTNINATRGVTGIIENAFNFNESNIGVHYGTSSSLSIAGSLSISAWIKPNKGSDNVRAIFTDWSGGQKNYLFWIEGNESIRFASGNGLGGEVSMWSDALPDDGEFHHVVVTRDTVGNNASIYIDGILNGSSSLTLDGGSTAQNISLGFWAFNNGQFMEGLIDEVGVWNKTLNTTEVTTLYNEGLACTINFCVIEGPEITLNSPADNLETTNLSLTFNATVLLRTTNTISNVSLYINNTINQTNTSGVNNSNYIFDVNFGFNNYVWLYEACDNVSLCTNSSTRSLDISTFIENNITFNSTTLETSMEDFELNITTIQAILSVSAFLNYNGTRFISTTSCVGVDCTITNTLDIPLVLTGENDNKTFFWEITAFDGTSSVSTNTTSNQQNVSRIHLEKCNATFTTPTLNFTAHDEQNLTQINPFKFDGTFQQWLGEGTVKRNNSFSDASTENLTLCIKPNDLTYFIDAQIDYDEIEGESTYTVRNYYFQNKTINNVFEDVSLYLLKASSSTSFILKVQDDSLLPIANILIESHRFYPGEGIFRIVQIARTDEAGKSVGFFETETVDYKFIITRNGTILLETERQKVLPETSPFTLTFNIGEPLEEPWQSQEEIDDLSSSLTITNSSGTVTYSYIDSSGDFDLGRLLVIRQDLTNSSNDTTICDVNSTLTSATLVCNVGTAKGFYIASAFNTRDSIESLDLQKSFQIETLSEEVGLLGLFFGWFLILIASFMFKFNEIAGIWSITVTIFLINLTGLINFGGVFVTAVFGVAIILTWIMEK